MTLKDFKTFFTEELSSIYPTTEIDAFFFLLMEEKLGLQRIDTALKPNFLIPEKELSFLNDALQRLKKEEPIQYILGKTEFYGLPFLVNPNTLIPRPETEELVAWVLEEVEKACPEFIEGLESEKVKSRKLKVESRKLKVESQKLKDQKLEEEKLEDEKQRFLSILDIGTGTGCIPIALAKNTNNTTISAIDISKEALETAKQNAVLNDVKINFFEMDILKADSLNESEEVLYDILVSNPPYVRNLEKSGIKNNVLQNEPHLALFVEDENPLIFYTKIADLARIYLKENGWLFFEINQYLGQETVSLLKEKGFQNIELKKDIFGNDRMIKALK